MLRVSSTTQIVELIENEKVLWRAPVSTSAYGMGEAPGSQKTPRGLHAIAEKIGAGCPSNTIFESRVPCGIWDGAPSEKDLILTRILWLEGLEESNRSTHARYIYFHGTNHESNIGTPASHGCIRLKNADMLDLFNRVETGAQVYIE